MLAVCAAFAPAAGVEGASASTTVVAAEARPTPIAAYAGRLAWSRFDPAIGAYRLMTRFDGQNAIVPVASRPEAFDVDLGPAGPGRVAAVYSRCEKPTPMPLNSAQRRPPEGCDIYRFDFTTGTEQLLRQASTQQSSEYLPSISNDRVAFVRVYERREGRRGNLPYVYVRNIASNKPSQRLPGGARGLTGRPGPTSVDLAGRRLALTWARRLNDGERYRSALRVVATDREDSEVIVDATSALGKPPELVAATLRNGFAYVAEQHKPLSRRNRFFGYKLERFGPTFFAQTPAPLVAAAPIDGVNRFAYSTCRQSARCEVGIAQPTIIGSVIP